jgi:integrase
LGPGSCAFWPRKEEGSAAQNSPGVCESRGNFRFSFTPIRKLKFKCPSGRGWRVENLRRTYSRLRDLAGLPKDLVLYLARHECGTKICRQTGIEYARRLLGQSNISTTQRYMHVDDNELADAQDLIE